MITWNKKWLFVLRSWSSTRRFLWQKPAFVQCYVFYSTAIPLLRRQQVWKFFPAILCILNLPPLKRIICFFVNLGKEYKMKLMWVRPSSSVVCNTMPSPCSWCIGWFTCFVLVLVVTCRWTLMMNTYLSNRGVFATFEKEHWIKNEGGFCTFCCLTSIVVRVCLLCLVENSVLCSRFTRSYCSL